MPVKLIPQTGWIVVYEKDRADPHIFESYNQALAAMDREYETITPIHFYTAVLEK